MYTLQRIQSIFDTLSFFVQCRRIEICRDDDISRTSEQQDLSTTRISEEY